MKTPFRPRRAFVLRVLAPGLSLLCPLALLALMVLFAQEQRGLTVMSYKDWLGFLAVWLIVLSVSFALLIATHEKLCFDHDGIERISGLRHHRIPYKNIKTIKLKMRPSRNGQVPAILIGTSPNSVPTEIFFYNYAPGEGRKMLKVLAQQAPGATWDQMALNFLAPRPPS